MAAGRTAVLASVPLRVGAGLAIVLAAWWAPYLIGAVYLIVVLFGVFALGVVLMGRRVFRFDQRVDCAQCAYRPLRHARICPQCKTPVMLRVALQGVAPGLRRTLAAAATAMAWADGHIDDREQEHLRAVLDTGAWDDGARAEIARFVDLGVAVNEVPLPDVLSAADAQRVLAVASGVLAANLEISTEERTAYFQLAGRLGVSWWRAWRILRATDAMTSV